MTGASPATVKRALERLVAAGALLRSGLARATRYTLPERRGYATAAPTVLVAAEPEPIVSPELPWSAKSVAARQRLAQSAGNREPLAYQRSLVDRYVPNQTHWLPAKLAAELAESGSMKGRQPAGTCARRVLAQWLIDLAWSSSRLEGNRHSLLAAADLFKTGLVHGDVDAIMLLNHQRAIEFMVDAVPVHGLTESVVCNVHALLLEQLLADPHALGVVRKNGDLPAQMFTAIIDKARQVKNPVEAAFFLWVNLAYLQPFEDGNGRASRLAANIPLVLRNCAPLSFNDIDPNDHALAMTGVAEQLDLSMATDLFTWTYRRSMKKYAMVLQSLESMTALDPLRLRYRESLADAIQLVVRERQSLREALSALSLDETSAPGLRDMLAKELAALGSHNCARYRLDMAATGTWVAAGRPS
ncbi:Fic family protein [Albitalea terrae]|uniref:Fic family protein n=1 Tax=Piscinibacter terrae TaxID=2496871 RepID=A0A3N7HLC9_9BURK|nr:Fic family protein [Albitalea terrae]